VITVLYTTGKYKRPDISLILNGVMAGLVSISSGCDEVAPAGAVIIGSMAGILTVNGTVWMDQKAKEDDPIGAAAVFGLCGGAGTIATGIFSTKGGLLYGGGGSLLAVQIIGVAAVVLWVSLTSYITFRIIDHITGLRVSEEEETAGLGISFQEAPHDYVDLLPEVKEDADYEHSLKATVKDIPIDIAIPVRGAMPGSGNWDGTALTRVDILCRQSRFEELKSAMNRIGVTGMTVSQVLGCGMQKGAAEYYRGIPMDIQLLPKMRVEIVVAKIPVSKVVNCARKILYTGHIGDGKIFIYDVRDAIKIRTGETGYAAMQGIEDVVS
jgi:Amt family ammonium transporter